MPRGHKHEKKERKNLSHRQTKKKKELKNKESRAKNAAHVQIFVDGNDECSHDFAHVCLSRPDESVIFFKKKKKKKKFVSANSPKNRYLFSLGSSKKKNR